MNSWFLLMILVGGVSAVVLAIEWRWERRAVARQHAAALQAQLPPRYRNGTPVSNAPMGAAELVFDETGRVAWNQIWGNFCDLALAGGPPHRDTPLQPATTAAIAADPAGYERVLDELERGLRMVTGWPVERDCASGWIALICPDEAAAIWLERAISVENITVERDREWLFLPAGPQFQLKHEIKNVVTVVAKTHHYWSEHAIARRPAYH